MEYIEKETKEIRENWFGDHVAEIQGEEGLQVIYWGKPATVRYYTTPAYRRKLAKRKKARNYLTVSVLEED
ncbi:hypothetical protein [Bacillus wiedmannii]|uniref:hypothetical protein n=1 Tax=Bacillus wiedmannii TaxID=1890302 RepID=UPI003F921B40